VSLSHDLLCTPARTTIRYCLCVFDQSREKNKINYTPARKMVNLPPGYNDTHKYAQDVIAFLHEPLSVQITGGIHVNDAFIYDAWANLPSEWTAWWENFSNPQEAQRDLINSLREEPEECDLPSRPEGLSQWLKRIRSLSLDRGQLVMSNPEVEVPDIMASRMVTKKLAEVRAGARFISQICKTNGITHVVDIGSGQGYLSLTLAASGLRVLAIDGSAKQIAGSQAAARQAGLTEGNQITHLTRFVTGADAIGAEIETWVAGEKCLLTGLHACGSLSEHMIRLATSSQVPCISHLAVVGCCYNHISPLSDSNPLGFPISSFMRLNNLNLSTSALITGCQAPTNWIHNPDSLFGKKHWYRAVLEKLLYDKKLVNQDQRPVWGIRNGDLKSFQAYAARALQSLNLTEDVTAEEIAEYEERYRHRTNETAILWTLSVLLCRVVESAIALDRVFFLQEAGLDADVLPIFDYKESPRNLMIVASR
jgi:SAM-dependent methyltransferase